MGHKAPIIPSSPDYQFEGFENSQGEKHHRISPLTHEVSSELPQLSAGGWDTLGLCPVLMLQQPNSAHASRNGSATKALLVTRAHVTLNSPTQNTALNAVSDRLETGVWVSCIRFNSTFQESNA